MLALMSVVVNGGWIQLALRERNLSLVARSDGWLGYRFSSEDEGLVYFDKGAVHPSLKNHG